MPEKAEYSQDKEKYNSAMALLIPGTMFRPKKIHGTRGFEDAAIQVNNCENSIVYEEVEELLTQENTVML